MQAAQYKQHSTSSTVYYFKKASFTFEGNNYPAFFVIKLPLSWTNMYELFYKL